MTSILMQSLRKDHALLVLTALLFGTIIAGGEFFSERGLSLFEISFYPLLGTSLLLLPFALKQWKRLRPADLLFFTGYGLVGAMLNLSQFGAITYGIPIATIVFLIYTEPAWTAILSPFLLRERIGRRMLIATIIALVGMGIMVGPSFMDGSQSPTGLLLALAAGVWFSLWLVIGRKREIHRKNFAFETFCFAACAALWLLVLHPILTINGTTAMMRFSWSFSGSTWMLLFLYACISDTIPNMCFYKAIEHVKASVAGIIMLLEPLAAAVIGTLFFHQAFTAEMAIGGTLILVANVVILRSRSSKKI